MVLIIAFFFASIVTSVLTYNAYEKYYAADLYYDLYKLNKLYGTGSPMKYLGTPSDTKFKLLLAVCIVCWICFVVAIIMKRKNDSKDTKIEIEVVCKKCGVPNAKGSKHCKNCGEELSE